MPSLLVPHRSGIHRTACFALFRALLRQNSRLPLDERQRLSTNWTLKAAFKQNASLTSPKRIIGALRLGYETLKLFQRFDEHPDHFRRIFELIATPKPRVPSPLLEASQKAGRRRPRAPRPPPRVWPHPNNKPVLSRPFLNLSGRRHVPILVVGDKVPFLRFKKPQSPYLSRIIRDKGEERVKRFLRRDRMLDMISLGREEDRWDSIVESICGVRSGEEPSWAEEHSKVLEQGIVIGRRNEDHAVMMATKMQEIVEQEQALADIEKRQRRHDKKQIREVRKEASSCKKGGSTGPRTAR